MAVDWNVIYEQKWNELAGGYGDQEKYINDAQTKEQGALDTQRAEGIKNLTNTRDQNLQQAYITRRQTERDMPGLLAAQGLKGGATETAVSSILRNYQNTRNAANNRFSQDQSALDTTYATNKAELGSKYANMLAELQQTRRNEAYQQAQFAYQAAQAEEAARLERERFEWEKQQAEEAARQAAAASRSSGGGGGRGSGGGGGGSGSTVSNPYNPNITKDKKGNTNKSNIYTLNGKTYYRDEKGVVHTWNTNDRWASQGSVHG